VDAVLNFSLEDRAEKARTATRDAMLGTQALAAAAATSAAGSGCPADGIVAAVIGITAASAASKTPCMREPRGSNTEDDMLEEQFEKWYAQMSCQSPPAWLEETDNATHFKSKENLLFWSERPSKYKEFIKMVWVEYGCPGHGKGPWDGLGAMAKTKVTLDLTDDNVQTPSGRITSPLEVSQHLRAQFCSRQWKKERMNMKINQVVVMYLDADEIVRPVAPPDVSPVKGILSSYSFCFLALRGTTVCESTSAGVSLVLWCAGVGMAVSHVISFWMFLDVCARSSLSGRKSSSPCYRFKV
jgi:hypothetical protein